MKSDSIRTTGFANHMLALANDLARRMMKRRTARIRERDIELLVRQLRDVPPHLLSDIGLDERQVTDILSKNYRNTRARPSNYFPLDW